MFKVFWNDVYYMIQRTVRNHPSHPIAFKSQDYWYQIDRKGRQLWKITWDLMTTSQKQIARRIYMRKSLEIASNKGSTTFYFEEKTWLTLWHFNYGTENFWYVPRRQFPVMVNIVIKDTIHTFRIELSLCVGSEKLNL